MPSLKLAAAALAGCYRDGERNNIAARRITRARFPGYQPGAGFLFVHARLPSCRRSAVLAELLNESRDVFSAPDSCAGA